MVTISATVDGFCANNLFDCQSPFSTVSSSFSSQIIDQQGIGTSVAVIATKGVLSCLVNLLPGPVDTVYDLILGRDWFNYCTTSVPDAEMLLPDDMPLFFFHCFRFLLCHRTGEYLS